jgi:hypothetical protein
MEEKIGSLRWKTGSVVKYFISFAQICQTGVTDGNLSTELSYLGGFKTEKI